MAALTTGLGGRERQDRGGVRVAPQALGLGDGEGGGASTAESSNKEYELRKALILRLSNCRCTCWMIALIHKESPTEQEGGRRGGKKKKGKKRRIVAIGRLDREGTSAMSAYGP